MMSPSKAAWHRHPPQSHNLLCSARDLGCVKTNWEHRPGAVFERFVILGCWASPYAFLSPSQGAYWDTQDGCDGPYVAMAAVSGLTPRIFITRVKL
jgi:hypothetical protein